MDQTEKQIFHAIDMFQKQHFLRRNLQLAVSIISIFSLVLFYSPGYVIFTNLCNFHYSTVLFSFFTHTLERKYVFLLCNGILAFLAKGITFGPPTETFPYSHEKVEENPSSPTKLENYMASMDLETVDTLQDNNVAPGVDEKIKEEPQKEEKEDKDDDGEAEVVEERNAEESSHKEEDEEQKEIGGGQDEEVVDHDDDDGEEEVEEEKEEMSGFVEEELTGSEVVSSREDILSPEELNKKFEEFIRKMKEEIRIEAQRQLIAA